MKFKCKYIKL